MARVWRLWTANTNSILRAQLTNRGRHMAVSRDRFFGFRHPGAFRGGFTAVRVGGWIKGLQGRGRDCRSEGLDEGTGVGRWSQGRLRVGSIRAFSEYARSQKNNNRAGSSVGGTNFMDPSGLSHQGFLSIRWEGSSLRTLFCGRTPLGFFGGGEVEFFLWFRAWWFLLSSTLRHMPYFNTKFANHHVKPTLESGSDGCWTSLGRTGGEDEWAPTISATGPGWNCVVWGQEIEKH